MILNIDTSVKKEIVVFLSGQDGKEISQISQPCHFNQAELLLPAITKLLKKAGLELSDLEKIRVASRGESFTSLRLGVVAANALAYGLGILVEDMDRPGQEVFKDNICLVKPVYDKEPNITLPVD